LTITIALTPALAERAGGRSVVHVDGTTVAEALRELTTRFPDLAPLIWDSAGALGPSLGVLLHEHDIHVLGGLETELRSGDELSLLTSFDESVFR
jgi:molybdopterin converting factor small subunit